MVFGVVVVMVSVVGIVTVLPVSFAAVSCQKGLNMLEGFEAVAGQASKAAVTAQLHSNLGLLVSPK